MYYKNSHPTFNRNHEVNKAKTFKNITITHDILTIHE